MTRHDAERKVKILDYIAATLRARGFPPSVREIARAVGLASTSAVHHHLQILEREGYLERGAAQGIFRRDIDPVTLYLSLSSMAYHYISNQYTLRAAFGIDFGSKSRQQEWLDHITDLILAYCCTGAALGTRRAASAPR